MDRRIAHTRSWSCWKKRYVAAAVLSGLLFCLISCSNARGIARLGYKEVRVGARRVLVNRFTDKAAFYWSGGSWEELQAATKTAVQALYDRQKALK